MSCKEQNEAVENVGFVVLLVIAAYAISVLCGCSMTTTFDWIREGGTTTVESRNTKEDWQKERKSDDTREAGRSSGWPWS